MSTLLHLGWSNAVVAALLALAAACVGRVCRRPAVVHACWLMVLLKLLTPPLVPLALPPFAPQETPPSVPDRGVALHEGRPVEDGEAPMRGAAFSFAESNAKPQAAPAIDAEDVVLAVWLTGSLAWWALAAWRMRRFHRLLHHARPASAEMQEQTNRLADLLGLRRRPGVWFISAPLSPLLWAWGVRPRLLLPERLWERLSAEQQDTLLAHELAHLRRGDHWVRFLEFVVLGLYWWHPVAWWARRRLQEAEEECCDARVVAALPGSAADYATALVETVAFLSQARCAFPLGASGAGQVPLLKRRLTMILSPTVSRRSSRLGFWVVLGLGALLLPLAPGMARPGQPAPPAEKPAGDTEREIKQLLALKDDLWAQQHGQQGWKRAVASDMRFCVQCHQVPQHAGEWQREKPETWRHAHDEVVRLMDEVRKKRAQLQEAEKTLQSILQQLEGMDLHKKAPADDGSPVVFTERTWDFGRMDGRIDRGTHRFGLTNRSGRSVRITAVRCGSGCVTAWVDKEVVPPGKQTFIQVELDARRFRGEKTATIIVEIEQVEKMEIPLRVRAFSTTNQQDKQGRLKELEQKVDSLLKEVEALRRDMRR